jgi:hypothetical protein
MESSLLELSKNLRIFIDYSNLDELTPWEEWISSTVDKIETRCWEKKGCAQKECPAHKNECGRCWLIAGTLCGGETEGLFAKKYKSCLKCKVYQNAVYKNPINELQENILVLIHSLKTKSIDLKDANSQIKVLSGMLPICSSCKKIRDDKGYWQQIEGYISKHSEAEFSHGICPSCTAILYPGITE